jgi:type II secretory pathway pseudopilin PulG
MVSQTERSETGSAAPSWRREIRHGRGYGERGRRQAGLSIIEVLVAAAILLIVAVGILPLFTRALVNNNAGNEYTQVSNHGKSRIEEAFQLPFNDPTLMTVPAGQKAGVVVEHYREDTETWEPGPTPSPLPTDPNNPFGVVQIPWERTTTIREYSTNAINDKDDNAVDLKKADALDGGTDPVFVHLKEVEVVVESTRTGGPLGAGKQVLLRTFKAK